MGAGIPDLESLLQDAIKVKEGHVLISTHDGSNIQVPYEKIRGVRDLKTLLDYVRAYADVNSIDRMKSFMDGFLGYNGKEVKSLQVGSSSAKSFEVIVELIAKDGKKYKKKESFSENEIIDLSKIQLDIGENVNRIYLEYKVYGKQLWCQ